MSSLPVDLELIKKYNVPGPRYTSYPPATQFTDQVEREFLADLIRENQESTRDLSLYFHIPFCESLCWFCGCTTVITTKHQRGADYLGTLDRDMKLSSGIMNPERRVVQMHFGGGTPTFLQAEEIRRLGEMIKEHFIFDENLEAGVEIDPRRLTRDQVVALRGAGFNRASMGVQDNNPKVQEAVHRIQPLEETRQAVDWLREENFESLNIDLIYGLPYQTEDSFEQTIDEIIVLNPDRLAIFSYAHVPWIKPAQKIITDDILPGPEVKLRLLKLTIEKLTAAGYVYIGLDHFAKPDDELAIAQREKTLQRNFQGYSTAGGADIFGFGMSSISQIPDAYWQNIKGLDEYITAVDRSERPIARGYLLTPEDRIRREVIMRMMCHLELDFSKLSWELDIDFPQFFASELESLHDMEDDGLLVRSEKDLKITDLGRLVIRNIAMRFDAYQKTEREQRFSKTI
ncbi:MAG TPA: oxygen-independent coproporphyrinogen III oxidase [Verrucomicrobiota bacterium]|nr:oxygen-independent coproporphyrinogen III oxidase [Verrucomicrobiota bacterium]